MGYAGSGSFDRGGYSAPGTVGNDFTPLLGGPFYKQLYYWNDWLQAHQDCFFAFHHDPFAKASVNIMVDFTLGKGYKLTTEGDDKDVAQALWAAFEEANDFQDKMRLFAKELSIYGENMLWWLPDNTKYIVYPRTKPALEDVSKVFLPRVRLIDPSNIVEIVTYPEDITRVVAYVWLTPTQYQTYSAKDEQTGKVVSGSKFIYQHIPASEMMHYKINAVSNEKRGRSDLFTALPYFKRLRDSVNYELIAQQKISAYAWDTTVEGNEQDLDNYVESQKALGTIPAAGSEYVHTAAVKRMMVESGSGGGARTNNSFALALSMVAASVGIPTSYYGTHLSSGSTRASALVSTEPVAKRFEMRQQIYSKVIKDTFSKLMEHFGLDAQCDVTFPEIVTQDRSQKLKDIYLAETAKWISPETAANLGAQELGIETYEFEQEQKEIAAEKDDEPLWANPLSAPPGIPQQDPSANASPGAPSSSAVTKNEKKKIGDNYGA